MLACRHQRPTEICSKYRAVAKRSALSVAPGAVSSGQIEPFYLDRPLMPSNDGEIVSQLHPEHGIRLQPESLFEPDRHFRGQAGLGVEQGAHGLAGDAHMVCKVSDLELRRLYDFGPEPVAWMD